MALFRFSASFETRTFDCYRFPTEYILIFVSAGPHCGEREGGGERKTGRQIERDRQRDRHKQLHSVFQLLDSNVRSITGSP